MPRNGTVASHVDSGNPISRCRTEALQQVVCHQREHQDSWLRGIKRYQRPIMLQRSSRIEAWSIGGLGRLQSSSSRGRVLLHSTRAIDRAAVVFPRGCPSSMKVSYVEMLYGLQGVIMGVRGLQIQR